MRAVRAGAAVLGVVPLGTFVLAALLASPVPAASQEDFRALDADRPTRVQDAFPVELREWEWETGLRGTLAEGGSAVEGLLELTTGAFLNGEVGVEAELALEDEDGTEAGLGSAGLHVLYSLNRETWRSPAFSVRGEVRSPGTGAPGREGWSARGLGIVTRSFDRLRVHANGGYEVASAEDGGDLWIAGLGFDYPMGLFSRAVVGDVYVELPADAGRTRVWAEVGTRWQVSNRSVVDVGVATRLDRWEAGEANLELVIGWARAFGIPSLIRVPPYPDPSIR